MKQKAWIALLLVLVLVACAKVRDEREDGVIVVPLYSARRIAIVGGASVFRFVDQEHGNVCYVLHSRDIDCVPLEEGER